MTSQDYIKVEHIRTLLLRSSLSKFRQFHSECCSPTLLQFDFFPFTRSMFSCYFCGFVVLMFCSPCQGWIFFYFLVWKFQTVFRWKPCFREALFCAFCWCLRALKLHLQVVALPAAMTMSWPAMLASKLNMSGLDFLALVLQKSNSLHLNAFIQVLFSLIGSVCRGNDSLLPSESLRSIFFLCEAESLFSVLFSVWSFKRFPR